MDTQTATIAIKSINVAPSHDPYVNITGIASRTSFWLDPRDNTCGVTQEYQTNSTSMDEWQGRVLSCWVAGHPTEFVIREWIEDNMDSLVEVCEGHSVEWNGNNMVGHMTDHAQAAWEAIKEELEQLPLYEGEQYEYWSTDEWLSPEIHQVKAETTDDELKALAAEWEPDSYIVVDDDILTYITARRDELKAEAEE